MLLTILLLGFCIKLWSDLGEVRRRLAVLEGRGVASTATDWSRPPAVVLPGEPDPVEAMRRDADLAREAREAAIAERGRLEEAGRLEAARAMAAAPAPSSSASVPSGGLHDQEDVSVARGVSLEGLFGRTLPIWGGGLTLAVAGILVVKWSIDVGLLSPAVRVALGMLFGLGLVGGAEASRRLEVSDERIPQSLAGAGVAALYGAVVAANLLYGLLGDGATMAALVGVTVAAGALSLRFGAPCAALGLVGGIAAPAIVGGEPDLPVLSVYVAMVSLAAAWLGRVRGTSWLSAAAMAGASLWSLGLVAAGPLGFDAAFVGVLVLCVGFAIPALSGREAPSALRAVGIAAAVVQCGMLVASGGHGPVQWTMLGAATALALLLSDRSGVRGLPLVAIGVFAAVAVSWSSATPWSLAVVLVVFAAMHAAHALWSLSIPERRDVADAALLVALPLTGCAIASIRFPGMGEAAGALVWGAGAALTFAAAAATRAVDERAPSRAAEVVGAVMAAVALFMALRDDAVPLALLALGACFAASRAWRASTLSFAALAALGASPVVLWWVAAVFGRSLSMLPVLTGDLPSMSSAAWVVPAAIGACALVAWRLPRLRVATLGGGAVLATVLAHLAWRHQLGVATVEDFVSRGMLDRTGWEAILAVAAVAAWRVDRRLAAGFALASLAHFGWFTLVVFDPMWARQAVGAVPLLNLVLVSHGVAIALLWTSGRVGLGDGWARARRICQMVVITMLAVGLLRQAFAGDVPADVAVSGLEQLLRSVAAIAVALGLLVHGLRTGVVDWRAGSLVLMLGAVTKVFVLDAAGLDGLARVASFAALGFSLIGVGWLYSRLLPERAALAA